MKRRGGNEEAKATLKKENKKQETILCMLSEGIHNKISMGILTDGKGIKENNSDDDNNSNSKTGASDFFII